MNPSRVEDKLAVNKYDVDKDIHIHLIEDICRECQEHFCLKACPASCFKLSEDRITFSFEGCLECGTCRIVCDREAVEWTLPRPGFGICYQYG